MSVQNSERKVRHREWNSKTIALLRQNHANLDIPHTIVNVFYVTDQRQAQDLVQRFRALGIRPIKDRPGMDESEERWSVYGETRLTPSVEELGRMTDLCVDIAADTAADYDGWFTEPEQ